MIRYVCACAALAVLLTAARAAELPGGDWFSFQIPFEGPAEGTAPARLAGLAAPAGGDGFVRVEGDEFVLSGSGMPVRFWGTNLCFAGCFPPHDVAERMARRLATLGINCVRFHHMDASGYPNGIWRTSGWGDFEHTDLHPEALDRLDYLVAQLKEHGVYTNLNLHVSREYGPADGFPAARDDESVPGYGKGVDNFYPRCIEEQKRYARMLLRHVNRYTGNAYAEEPAVAMVEISNEDGLLWAWAGGALDALPEQYARELERQWNVWLRERYASTAALRDAWGVGEVEGGEADLLDSPDVRGNLEEHEGASARVRSTETPEGDPARLIEVAQAGPATWHVQYTWSPFAIEKGTSYVLRVRLRANRADTVGLNCMMSHAPWEHLGLTRTVRVGPEWREYELYFVASRDEAPKEDGSSGTRITLSGLSKEGLQVAFTRPTLSKAAVTGLMPGERLAEGVSWPGRDAGGRTSAVRRDMVRFLRETEVGYWNGMRRYLHDELGVRMPVTGTAVGFTSPYVAAESADFVDSHSYWQHPHFPGRPWDAENWIVPNRAMVNASDGGTIAGLAARRVFGLPYTVTEYNHPRPNEYCAEAFPLVAVFGARQRWQGMFQFAYCHNDDYETDRFSSFFDMKGDPAKLALMPACSAVFRHGLLGPARQAAAGELSLPERLDLLFSSGPRAVDAYAGGVSRGAWSTSRIGVKQAEAPHERDVTTGHVEWRTEDGGGVVSFSGPGCAGLIGFCDGEELELGGVRIRPGGTSLDGFSAVMLASVDGQGMGEGGSYLLTAVAGCVNPDMGWNEEHNSVGTRWGDGPTLCEGVPLTLTARGAEERLEVYPLSPEGKRRERVRPQMQGGGSTVFRLGPRQRTLWYELVVAD